MRREPRLGRSASASAVPGPVPLVRVTVIMPAHNEASLLEPVVREVVDGIRARNEFFEVLVVENGSHDATPAIAQRLERELPELRVETLPRADYGHALRTGLRSARGDIVVNFDVDYTDLGFLDAALARLGQPDAPAIIVGSKRAPGAHDRRARHRRLVTWAFAFVMRAAFGLRVSDTHGLKVLDRRQVVAIGDACRSDGELFDTELILRAERAGLGIEELAVTVTECRPSRTSIGRRALRALVGLVRLRAALARRGP